MTKNNLTLLVRIIILAGLLATGCGAQQREEFTPTREPFGEGRIVSIVQKESPVKRLDVLAEGAFGQDRTERFCFLITQDVIISDRKGRSVNLDEGQLIQVWLTENPTILLTDPPKSEACRILVLSK
jgi:hypothetical protein